MTNHQPQTASLYMLLAAGIGFFIGRSCKLQDQPSAGSSDLAKLGRKLDQQRRVLNDAHKTIHAVSKGMKKAAPQTH